MRSRSRAYRRPENNRRKTVGAVVVAGVLVAAGLAGVQIASASTETEAGSVITVDGQQFDVSKCAELEIKAGAVICDGKALEPEAAQGAGDAAQESALALDAACDKFAADLAAAEGEQAGGADEQAGGADAGAGEAEKQDPAAQKAANKKLAKKYTKVLKAAEKAPAPGDDAGAAGEAGDAGAADDAGAAGNAGAAADAAAAAVTSAQQALLQSCLAVADAKAAAAAAAGDAAGGAGDEAGDAGDAAGDAGDAAGDAGADQKGGADDAGAAGATKGASAGK